MHGIAGAKAAGMRVIGFTGAAHSYPGHADALTEAGAETVIRRWAELQAGVLAALAEWSETSELFGRLVALLRRTLVIAGIDLDAARGRDARTSRWGR